MATSLLRGGRRSEIPARRIAARFFVQPVFSLRQLVVSWLWNIALQAGVSTRQARATQAGDIS